MGFDEYRFDPSSSAQRSENCLDDAEAATILVPVLQPSGVLPETTRPRADDGDNEICGPFPSGKKKMLSVEGCGAVRPRP